MKQTPEADAFIQRVLALPPGPGVSLDDVLQPSLNDESDLRKLYATDRSNPRLKDPFVGLLDVFSAPVDVRTTRARVVAGDEVMTAKYVMPLRPADRRNEGTPCTISDLDEFKKNWAIFTEGSLSQLLDWSNVVAAGGAVLACLAPMDEAVRESKRSRRKYFHSVAYPTSDVDLFLYGLNSEQAEKRIVEIYEAVRDSVPWDVTCIRTKHTVSIHSQYPYRSIQIVLRLYSSPAEILAGFDIDAPSCLYNGERVSATPRCIVSLMRQANTVDMTRRSPSYEVRLAKYSKRGFEVFVPSLNREKIDPTIYERAINGIEGLARLLVLEKLYENIVRNRFLESRRELRGRPNSGDAYRRYRRRKNKFKGDLKVDTSIIGLEMNDYDVASLHIPYGPGWTARRIDKLVYQTDLGMNSTFNPKNKGRRLHRHPAFFGTMEECLKDCCEHCPDPIDADERALQAEEDKQYIRGHISFMEEDPGRQLMTGSFKPIDVGEWSNQVYIGPTEALFTAIVSHDRDAIAKLINEGVDVNRRDHVGRKALHVAILVKDEEIAGHLIDAGAQMMSRVVDGRNALHMAAQMDLPGMVRKLMERSRLNKEKAEKEGKIDVEDQGKGKEAKTEIDKARLSSEDDWTSEDDGVISMDTDEDGNDEEGDVEDDDVDGRNEDDENGDEGGSPQKKEAVKETEDASAEVLNDDDDLGPDILDINLPDWDLGFTPLCHAIFYGSTSTVSALLEAGADPNLPSKGRNTVFHPLAVTIMKEDEDEASKIAEVLIRAGASSSAAEQRPNVVTIFQRAVRANKVKLVGSFLNSDPNADAVMNFPSKYYNSVLFPVVTAINTGQYAMLATLLAHGAKLVWKEEDVAQAGGREGLTLGYGQSGYNHASQSMLNNALLPLETAIARHDDVAPLLIALGAGYNTTLSSLLSQHTDANPQKSLLDWVRNAIDYLDKKTREVVPLPTPAVELDTEPEATGWKRYVVDLIVAWDAQKAEIAAQEQLSSPPEQSSPKPEDVREYLLDLERVLVAAGAESWAPLVPPETPSTTTPQRVKTVKQSLQYATIAQYHWRMQTLPQYQAKLHDELFEACFIGDNQKVQDMCLPPKGSGATPLSIYVQASDPTKSYERFGYTPLFAAIAGGQWTTAKLVLAIAAAQHKPKDQEKVFSTKGINLDDDAESDSGSDDSYDSDATVEQEDVTFIDVAKKPSAIETPVHPKALLNGAKRSWHVKGEDGKYSCKEESLLVKAVLDDDLDTFTNLLRLYKSSPLPIDIPTKTLDTILHHDRAEMLDEYIRQTGGGINVKPSSEDTPTATNDQNRLYLGLNVHGKKRADLAKRNDPNATHHHPEHPLVWTAALKGATKIVEYLVGERPLAAYKYYGMTNGDEFALRIRRVQDLDKVLPTWLGWDISDLGDSPLLAAVIGGKLELIKQLFTKKAKLMGSCLHKRVKFIGYSALMLAVHQNASTDVIDFLLRKSLSPVDVDLIRGWNIYHIMCQRNSCDLLEHCLTKLPRDTNETLLTQQSKGRCNTPLHLAVKQGSIRAVDLILSYTKSALLIRDVDGSTPLHCAVQRGFATVSQSMLSGASDVAYMENGVGETPLDMCTLQSTLERTSNFRHQGNIYSGAAVTALPPIMPHNFPHRIKIEVLEQELPLLRDTLMRLRNGKGVREGTKVAEEFDRFITKMEPTFKNAVAQQAERAKEKKEQPAEKNPRDRCDRVRTLEVINNAVAVHPRKRLLVHLFDVQKSVQANLSRYEEGDRVTTQDDDADGFEGQEKRDEKEGSLVFDYVDGLPDSA